jgi:putative transcriptional regulator
MFFSILSLTIVASPAEVTYRSKMMTETPTDYLTGQLLIAMPAMRDPRFARTVIFVCAHNDEGAMGLVLNRLIGSISFEALLEELAIGIEDTPEAWSPPAIHFGGPMETGRGFVLHSADYISVDSIPVNEHMAVTSTVEILRDIALGQGPGQAMLALGYAGWGPGQLDDEMQENAWLNVAADDGIIFDHDLENKWERALAKIGVDASLLSTEAGHA